MNATRFFLVCALSAQHDHLRLFWKVSNEYFFCNVKIVGCIDVGLNLNRGVLLIFFFIYIFQKMILSLHAKTPLIHNIIYKLPTLSYLSKIF